MRERESWKKLNFPVSQKRVAIPRETTSLMTTIEYTQYNLIKPYKEQVQNALGHFPTLQDTSLSHSRMLQWDHADRNSVWRFQSHESLGK